jgi:hypothetical protein
MTSGMLRESDFSPSIRAVKVYEELFSIKGRFSEIN